MVSSVRACVFVPVCVCVRVWCRVRHARALTRGGCAQELKSAESRERAARAYNAAVEASRLDWFEANRKRLADEAGIKMGGGLLRVRRRRARARAGGRGRG